ncbi:MAG: flagellar hook basal-body protein [Deltaproteobacteria bacterium]|jgi:flagellar basal-body rod protein FlgF|nr:flagellar hook basal-body protein [Deltaproteobacteria bacterium]MBT4527808.1 flagellar hook basal-body protein [Deltaproteobacteria bacterium]
MSSTFSLLSAFKGLQKKMDAVSNNLANVNTPGFKRDTVVFKEYYNKLVGQDLESAEEHIVQSEFQTPYSRGSSSFAIVDHISPMMHKGDFKATNNPNDLALQTDGFFVVDSSQGLRYTRNGQFLRDGQGYLTTTIGDRVLGKTGAIKITGQDFIVESDGRILVDNAEIDQFKVVIFEQPFRLTKLGNSYWVPGSNTQKPIDNDNFVVQQGSIESSNVDSVLETVEMITVNRSYEAVQKAMHAKGGLDEKSISIAKI